MISLILSGGVGSRLWPLSREKFPKQFAPILSQTLFTKTVLRLSRLGEVQVCTSETLKGLTESEIRNQKLNVSQIYFEPMGKNTAPAVALACRVLEELGQADQILGMFPADHFIEREDTFFKAIDLAQKCAELGQVVTIGVKPHYPATGFGYIECLRESFKEDSQLKAFKVRGFKEKPDFKTAEQYLKEGNFFWNSGIFVFKVSTMIAAFQEHLPKMWAEMQKLKIDSQKNLLNLKEVYSKIESQSLDYGIMEHISNQVNIPCDMGWSDLGSWDDIAEISKTQKSKSKAEILSLQSENCFAYSLNAKKICFSGVKNLLVVDTEDALLITEKNKSQEVKALYDELKKEKSLLVSDHNFEYRPWGYYRNLYEEPHFKSKVITVDPLQQLSYQSHKQRSEIWVIVEGEGEVVLNDETLKVEVGKVIHIPLGSKHRIRNSSQKPLKFVEVQLGEYFGEDDITRYQDDYQRT